MTEQPGLFDEPAHEYQSPPPPPPACPTCGRPYATDRGHHAARNSDPPESSKEAVKNRAMGWDTQRGRALRIFYAHRHRLLTHYDVEVAAVARWGPGALGDCPWKRSGELATEYDPPLIEVAWGNGAPITLPGKHGDPCDALRITPEGIAWVLAHTDGTER